MFSILCYKKYYSKILFLVDKEWKGESHSTEMLAIEGYNQGQKKM